MALAFDRPRRLDSRERALISTVSRLGADALTRAQRFEQEQRVADTLQASLQPEQFPLVDGWRFTGVSMPGEAGLSVGGDWYDVAILPHGVILLSVGDVTGRGPVAAGVMGTVRAAVRALALSDPDPASILEHTDDLLRGSTVDQLATAWVGLLEPATGALRFASAGHVPPLVLGPRGRRFLDDSPGLLLGTGLPGSRRSWRHEIEPDASIVAYTDGLCERRGESLEVGLKRMAVALGDGIGLDAAKVVRRLVGRPTADDIAIVVATRLPATAWSARSEQSVAAAG
jgi:serine phosphatase RsbU (regulator of sigma subunit)